MSVIHASGRASKTEPPPRLNPPTPAADYITSEQRRQQTVWRRHARALMAFLEAPSAASEARVRGTGNRWIASFLGEGQDAEQAHRFLDDRLFKVRLPVLAQHLHNLGPRPVAECLLEIAGHDDGARTTLLAALERYAKLDPATVRGVGGDVFPPIPLHEVPLTNADTTLMLDALARVNQARKAPASRKARNRRAFGRDFSAPTGCTPRDRRNVVHLGMRCQSSHQAYKAPHRPMGLTSRLYVVRELTPASSLRPDSLTQVDQSCGVPSCTDPFNLLSFIHLQVAGGDLEQRHVTYQSRICGL